jgi:hypothetical protein
VLGCGWWASSQILILALPALVWVTRKRQRPMMSVAVVLPTALVGTAPWIATNLRHGWYSTHLLADSGGPFSRLHGLAAATLPTALGLRVPFSLHWLGTVALGVPFYLLALVALVAPGRGHVRPLLLVLLAFPFLYAVSPYTSSNVEPRYLWLLLPVLALLLARWATTAIRGLALIGAALALSVAGLAAMVDGNLTAPRVELTAVPADFDPLLRTLREHRVTRVWANYWIAWRITFESGERIVAASTGTGSVRYERLATCVRPVGVEPGRYPPYFEAVRSAAGAAFVFVAGTAGTVRRLLEGVGYREVETGGFAVELPRRRRACSSTA